MEYGYWGIKALAEPARWLIAYFKLECTQWMCNEDTEWFGSKNESLGLDFPNLPYLIDGDFKLTESSAIPGYLASKAGREDFNGEGPKERATLRMLEGVFGDFKKELSDFYYSETEHKANWEKFLTEGTEGYYLLHKLSKYLGEKEYLLGHITNIDVSVAYYLWMMDCISASLHTQKVQPFENLRKLSERVRALPGIKEWIEANKHVPFMSPGYLKFEILQ